MAPWANGKNGKEYRATHGHASRSSASSAWASRSRIAGRTRCRARPRSASGSPTASPTACALVHQVLRRAPRPRAGCKPVEDIYRRACTAGEKYLRNEAPARPRGPRLLAADRLVLRRRARREPGRGPRARLVPGARRGPHPVRDGARPAARRGAPGAVQDARSCRTSPPSPTRSARQLRGIRPARRQPRGDLRDHRSTTSGARSARTSASPISSGVSFRGRARGPDAELLPAPRARHARAAAIRCSRASRTRRASSTASRGSRSKPRAPFAEPAA